MWTTRGHLIIKTRGAEKQQMRCRPAGTSSSLIIMSPSSEVCCLHIRHAFESKWLWMCKNSTVINVCFFKLCARELIRERMGTREGQGEGSVCWKAWTSLQSAPTWRPDNCLSSERYQEARRHDGSWEENVTRLLCDLLFETEEPFNFTNSLFFYIYSPSAFFLSLLTLQRFMHFIFFFYLTMSLLNSLTWL